MFLFIEAVTLLREHSHLKLKRNIRIEIEIRAIEIMFFIVVVSLLDGEELCRKLFTWMLFAKLRGNSKHHSVNHIVTLMLKNKVQAQELITRTELLLKLKLLSLSNLLCGILQLLFLVLILTKKYGQQIESTIQNHIIELLFRNILLSTLIYMAWHSNGSNKPAECSRCFKHSWPFLDFCLPSPSLTILKRIVDIKFRMIF